MVVQINLLILHLPLRKELLQIGKDMMKALKESLPRKDSMRKALKELLPGKDIMKALKELLPGKDGRKAPKELHGGRYMYMVKALKVLLLPRN